MDYNTQRKSMPMPEYGRAVQDMVDHALTIEDRQERQRCANSIIGIMAGMFPSQKEQPDFQVKLWDHLAYMSDYRLDIDYPYEITRIDKDKQRPQMVAYPKGNIRFRHYGRMVPDMIRVAVDMEDGPERRQLVRLLAVQMKKDLLTWNRELYSDRKVADDLAYLSGGRLNVSDGDLDVTFAQAPGGQQAGVQNRRNRNRQGKNRRRF